MKTFVLRILVTVLSIQAFVLAGPSTVHAQEETCPQPTNVSIDVRPGENRNKINLSARGLLPVAVLSTPDFDASQFTPEMAHLSDAATATDCAGAVAVRLTYVDVNGDGLTDLLFFFRIQELNVTLNTTEVVLMAHGSYNSTTIHIHGTDLVQVKP